MGLNMSQSITETDRRAIAQRLFAALCERYPGKYIALILPPDVADDGSLAPDLSNAKPGA
jgi:hypothetical protein